MLRARKMTCGFWSSERFRIAIRFRLGGLNLPQKESERPRLLKQRID